MTDRLDRPTGKDGEPRTRLIGDLERRRRELNVLVPLCDNRKEPARYALLVCECQILNRIRKEPGFVEIAVLREVLLEGHPDWEAYLEEAWDTVETYLTTGVVEFTFDEEIESDSEPAEFG